MNKRILSAYILGFAIFALLGSACSRQLMTAKPETELMEISQEVDTVVKRRVLIYRTVANFDKYVPVLLSSDKSRIVKFTDYGSLSANLAPISLKDGYLLDNWQINVNVAFLEFTYKEYNKLQLYPVQESLIEHVLVKKPLTELWDCGFLSEDEITVERLNELIDNNFIDCISLINK